VNVGTVERRLRAIPGFRRDVDICALLEYYAASSGNSLPTFRDNVLVPLSKGQEVLDSDVA
jgi:hypothetical protein